MVEEEKLLLNTRIEENDSEIHQLSLHQADMENQLNDANQEVINLRIENEGLRNDLKTKKRNQ